MTVALISFSNNYDMQEHLYSLQKVKEEYITIGSKELLCEFSLGDNNYLFNVPNRPAIEMKTFNFMELLRVVKLIRNKKISSVVFISGHTWNYFLSKLIPQNITKYHIFHEIEAHKGEKITPISNLYIRKMIKVMDKIIVHSENYVEKVCDNFNLKRENIYYIPPWMEYYPYREWKKPSKSCLFFGRINQYKGIETLIQLAKNNKDISFVVVGKPAPEVHSYIKEMEEIENIQLVDKYVSENEIHNYFYDSEIVILPYREASQSGVIIEAYRHSKPVIAFDVGNLKEQIDHNITGFTVPEGDYKSMEATIKEYLSFKEDIKQRYCEAAWQFGKSKFTPEVAATFLSNIIESELNKNDN